MAARGERTPPHPALVEVIEGGDQALAEVLERAGERLRRLIPERGLPAWGSPEGQALRQAMRAIVARMYRELGEVVRERAQAALGAGLRASSEEMTAWLTQAAFMEEFERETLEALRELATRAEGQVAGLAGALGDVGD